MGKFHDIEIEIQSRFYRWAVRDAEREVREGYPLLRRIESRTVKAFLRYMSEFPQDVFYDPVRFGADLGHQPLLVSRGELARAP